MFIDRPDSYWVFSMDAVLLRASRFSITYRRAAADPTRGIEGSQCSAPASSSWRWYADHHTNKRHISETQSLSNWTTARMTTKSKAHPYSRATSVGMEREREKSFPHNNHRPWRRNPCLLSTFHTEWLRNNSVLCRTEGRKLKRHFYQLLPNLNQPNAVVSSTDSRACRKTALDLIQTVGCWLLCWYKIASLVIIK